MKSNFIIKAKYCNILTSGYSVDFFCNYAGMTIRYCRLFNQTVD